MASILLLLFLFIHFCRPWILREPKEDIQKVMTSGTSLMSMLKRDRKADIQKNPTNETSLMSMLEEDRKAVDEAYSNALRHLDDMERKPTCDRTATVSLITTCQAVGGEGENESKNNDELLAVVKDVFATRLALCELQQAGISGPAECGHVVHFSLKRGQTARPTELSQAVLEPCTQALFESSKQWTTYSNNRQNAHKLCYAARIDIEKDIMIYTAREITNNTASINDALERSLRRYDLQLRKQDDFRRKIEAFNLQLVSDLEKFNNTLGFRLDEIMADAGRRLIEKAEQMASTYSLSETSAAALRENIGNSTSYFENIVKLHKKMHADILSHRAEIASKEKGYHETNSELAARTQQSLEEMMDGKLIELARSVELVLGKSVSFPSAIEGAGIDIAQEKTSVDIDVLKEDLVQLRQGLELSNNQLQLHNHRAAAQFEIIHMNNQRTLQQQEAIQAIVRNLSLSLKEIAATAQDAAKSLKFAAPFVRFFAYLEYLMICFLVATALILGFYPATSDKVRPMACFACCFLAAVLFVSMWI
ncbi:MAG: hypothetical protein Q9160_005653 [Pyrenula sp. 1 TL-2023]